MRETRVVVGSGLRGRTRDPTGLRRGSRSGQAGRRSGQAERSSGQPGRRTGQAGRRSGQAGWRSGQAGRRSGQAGWRSGQAGWRSGQAGWRSGQAGSLLSALLWSGSLILTGCSTGRAEDNVFRIPVTIEASAGNVVFMAEIADTNEERARGLMFRESLKPDHGMLFLFPAAQQNSFWMKNTLIPLDLLFIREDFTVLGIVENAQPRTTVRQSVPGASQFVLEINGGFSAKHGIRAGQRVRFTAPIPMSVAPAPRKAPVGSR